MGGNFSGLIRGCLGRIVVDVKTHPRHERVTDPLSPRPGVENGQSLAGRFCCKAIEEHAAGNACEVIILVNSVHSQKWQAPLYDYVVCFVDHRIKFVNGDGGENENPTFQNIFVYLGPRKEEFATAFSKFGYVMVPA